MNVYCYDKHGATDTIHYDKSAIDGGSTYTQLFVGTKSLVSNLYGMNIDKHFSIPWRITSLQGDQ